eukprot:Skav233427  [mRNA]  locus=scaffold1486:32639:42297:+ [translate_table: standard]
MTFCFEALKVAPSTVSASVQVAASVSVGLAAGLRPRQRCQWRTGRLAANQKAVYDFIEEAGVGSYQIEQVLLVACFFFSDLSTDHCLAPRVGPGDGPGGSGERQLRGEGEGNGSDRDWAGTLLAGVLGDNFGRRVPILLGYLGVMAGSVGMWSAPSPIVVGIFRALTGFSVGIGVPASLTTIAEIAPAKSRAMLISVCYAALALGGLYAACACGLQSQLQLHFQLHSSSWRLEFFRNLDWKKSVFVTRKGYNGYKVSWHFQETVASEFN